MVLYYNYNFTVCVISVILYSFISTTVAIESDVPDIKNLPQPQDGSKTTPEEEELWCRPEQVHLSCGSSYSEMVVMWSTAASCNSPHVSFSESPWNLSCRADSHTVTLKDMQKGSLSYVHRAVLTGLSPLTTYYFRPLTNNGVGTKPMYFRSLPDDNTVSQVSFLVSGDLDMETLSAVENEMSTGAATAFIYNGDVETELVATPGKDNVLFMSRIELIAGSHPFMVVPGKRASTGKGRYLFQQMFSAPKLEWPMPENRLWYSFDAGLVHVISYSTQILLSSNTSLIEAQKNWLLKDLTDANKKRAKTPWVVAFGRDPMYCAYGSVETDDCARNASKVRHGLEDLFYVFGVDLVIESAHTHYERSKPKYKGVNTNIERSYEQPRAPVEVVMGYIGSGDVSQTKRDASNVTAVESNWLAAHFQSGEDSHYGRLTVHNSSHLQWDLLSATEKNLLDTFVIVQETHGNFNLANLPHNVSHKINQTIIAQGGKPGTYDFIGGAVGELGQPDGDLGWSRYSMYLGLGIVAGVLFIVIGLVTIRSCVRRRGHHHRRWGEGDTRGGDSSRGFHSVGSGSDTEEDDNDFEIDVYEKAIGSKQSSKLLTSY